MEKKKNDVRLNKALRDIYIKDARRFLESQTNNPKYQAFLESRENCRTKRTSLAGDVLVGDVAIVRKVA